MFSFFKEPERPDSEPFSDETVEKTKEVLQSARWMAYDVLGYDPSGEVISEVIKYAVRSEIMQQKLDEAEELSRPIEDEPPVFDN